MPGGIAAHDVLTDEEVEDSEEEDDSLSDFSQIESGDDFGAGDVISEPRRTLSHASLCLAGLMACVTHHHVPNLMAWAWSC